MTHLRFLADMNISPKTVEALQKQGYDIIRVSQVLLVNTSDWKILEFARQEDRSVITQDLDFSALLALSGYSRPSLITLRLSASDPEMVTERLLDILPQIEQILREGCAITVEDLTTRIRRLPIE